MTYRTPEISVLGDAAVVIQGSKPAFVEPDLVTHPGIN